MSKYEYSLKELRTLKGCTNGAIKRDIIAGILKPNRLESVLNWLGAEVKMAVRNREKKVTLDELSPILQKEIMEATKTGSDVGVNIAVVDGQPAEIPEVEEEEVQVVKPEKEQIFVKL